MTWITIRYARLNTVTGRWSDVARRVISFIIEGDKVHYCDGNNWHVDGPIQDFRSHSNDK